MSLSCDCSDDDGEWYHEDPSDYKTIEEDEECCSCKKQIKAGELLIEFPCFKFDEDGDEEYMDPWFMCEKCADIYHSLEELGFCIYLSDSMEDLLHEYHTDYLGINHDERQKNTELQ